MDREYFSQRTGAHPDQGKFDFNTMKSLILKAYASFQRKDYFQEAFGFECVDSGSEPGTLGDDLSAAFMIALRKPNIWPFEGNEGFWEEHDVFDVIEFLYDHVSKPVDGYFHDWNQCGWHYHTFDKEVGRKEFRETINKIIGNYDVGYELSIDGEIMLLGGRELKRLMSTKITTLDREADARIQAAVRKFGRGRSSVDDRRDAVKALADVLERIRPSLKKVLTNRDDRDLFEIANKFGIRHFNVSQKIEYDESIWLSWMFHFYLATLHASTRMIEKHETSTG